jgi:LuxR family transcriptional regulator, maltose regulon positive regulatory protein
MTPGGLARSGFRTRIPAEADRFVPRPRLSATPGTGIEQAADEVVLVTGPLGSGKTSLVGEWARSVPVAAWVSLGEGDDARSLWATVLSMMPEIDVQLPARGPFDLEFVSDFACAAEDLPQPVWLFLDEIENLSDPEALRSLSLLLRWPPGSLRLVLAGRFEPSLGIARLRMDGRLREIRARELTFTRDEAAELLKGHDLCLDDTAMDALMDLTEGWAAGLRLAALALENANDPPRLLAGFAGDDRAVADYLVGELFTRQSRREHGFMLSTSVCDELTPTLAAALSGLDDAGEILDRLCRTNALTDRSDAVGGTYRYHRLLRAYLRAELRRARGGASIELLHASAARWYAANGDFRHGIEHALATHDAAQVSDLIERAGPGLVLSGQISELRSPLAKAPQELTAAPSVRLIAAASALEHGDVAEADAALHGVRTRDPRWAALHATLRLQRDRITGAQNVALDDLVAAAKVANDPDIDELTRLATGATHLLLGDADEAEAVLRRTLSCATALNHDHVALRCLAGLAAAAVSRGDVSGAGARAAAAIDFAAARGQEQSTACGHAYLVAGYVAYLRLHRDAAQQYASLAGELLGEAGESAARFAATALGAAVGFDSDVYAGTATLAALRTYPEAIRGTWEVTSLLEPVWVAFAAGACLRMSLWIGETGWATDAIRRANERLGDTGDVHVLEAKVEIHRGRIASARRSLAPVLTGELSCVAAPFMVRAWLLDAVAADLAGDARQAHRALTEAARIAEPLTVLRPFHDSGRRTRDLLARYVGRFGRLEAFVEDVLHAVPGRPLGPAERLSERELEVLAELPSLRTMEEIANDLGVSVNTIKTHQRSIYRKFDVGNRRGAITEARRLGLL